MSNTDFLLALERVTVSFDGFKAVNDLNLYVDKGELRVIIGPTGAGKSTRSSAVASAASSRHPPSTRISRSSRISSFPIPRAATFSARCSGSAHPR